MTRSFARAAVLLVLLSGIAGLSALAQSSATSVDELPIHRVTLTDEKLAAALKEADEGNLVRMSPTEFDRLLGDARSDRRAVRATPSVVEARYRAKYDLATGGESSLVGTAEWSIRRPRSGSTEVKLDGLQLALRQAKWSDGTDAVLYRLPADPHPYIHLPDGDSHTLNLEWSGRGLPEPGEVQFELRVPAVPVATLELELANGLVPVLPQAEALLTGPYPAGAGDSLWRISFGGMSRLEIILRRATDTPGVMFARVAAAQSLSVAEATGRYEFQVESAKIGFTELTFQHDPEFMPTSIRVNNLENWSAAAGGEGGPAIVVRLREPTRSAAVVISGAMKMPLSSQPWASPGVWLNSAVHRSERLTLTVGPGLILRDWNPRGFRLTRSELTADQSYTLETESGLPPVGGVRAERPTLKLGPRMPRAWTAIQRAEWQINPDGELLSVKTTVPANGTPPRTIRFPLPAGWLVERVQSGTSEVDWSVTRGAIRRLEVDCGPPGRGAEINITLRRSTPRSRDEQRALPDLLPEGCSTRSGTLTVRAGPGLELIPSDPVPDVPGSRQPGPQEFVRMLTSEPLAGWLVVRLRQADARIDITSSVRPGRPPGAIHSDLTLTPENGPVTDIALRTVGPVAEPWEWRDDQGHWVANAVRVHEDETRPWLLALAPAPSVAAVSSLAGVSKTSGYRWRLKLPRPVDRPTTIHSDYSPVAGSSSRVWPVPWALRSQFQASVWLPAKTPVEEIDRWWVPLAESSGERLYRYGNRSVSLPPVVASAIPPEFQRLRLLTSLSADGDCDCLFQLRVRHWNQGFLLIGLPPGVYEAQVSVAGRPIPVDRIAGDKAALKVPVPESATWIAVQINYRLPRVTGSVTARMPRSPPSGPFPADAVQYVWQISPEWQLLSAEGLHLLPGSAVSSPSLPLPDLRRIGSLADWNRTTSKPIAVGQQESLSAALARAYPDQVVLVDVPAVEAAGLSPSDVADGSRAAELLRLSGLVAVPRAEGIVVTSPADVARWNSEWDWRGSWPADVKNALAEAAQFGQDRSGRFCQLAHWADQASDVNMPFARAGWLVAADRSDRETGPLVYRRDRVEYICWALAMAFGVLTIAVIRSVRIGLLLLVVACCLLGCFHAFYPVIGSVVAGPFLTVAAFAGLVHVLRARRRPQLARPVGGSKALVAAGSALVVAAIGTIASADPQLPGEVYQFADADGNVTVLVPRALFERLRADRTRAPQAVAITAASYSAAPDGGTVRFHARYRLFNFREQDTPIRIPLHGVRFRSVALDGAEAREIDGDADGLRVTVAGQGAHTLDIDFAVPVATAGTEQELKFAIPEVPVAKLTFELPGAISRLRTGAWRGAVRTVVTPRATTLETDLGQSSAIALRWPGGGDRTSAAQCSEITIWQVGAGAATMTSTIDYRVSGGPVGEFQIALPAQTEVCRLTAVGDPGIGGASAMRIKDWTVLPAGGPGPRRLRIELLHPVTGRVSVRLEMASTAPAGDRITLQCPRALGVATAESLAALEFQGIEEPARVDVVGWTELSAPAVVELVKAAFVDVPYLVKPSRVFRAARANPGGLSFPVRASATGPSVNETALWWVDSTQLTGMVESRWTGMGITHMGWKVPPSIRVSEVSGRNIVSWSQSGSQILVWLDRPVPEVVLTWRAIRVDAPGDGSTIEIPAVGHAGAHSASLVRRVRPVNGWVVVPRKAETLGESVSPLVPGEIAWRCSVDQKVELALLPPATNAAVNVRTAIDTRSDRFQSTHVVDLSALRRDRPHVISFLVPTSRDDEVQFTAPAAATVAEVGGQKSLVRRWDVAIPKGMAVGADAINVRVVSGAVGSGSWRLPEVAVRFAAGHEPMVSETISVESDQVSLSDSSGLEPLSPTRFRVVRRPCLATVVRSIGLKRGEVAQVTSAVIVAGQAGRTWRQRFNCNVACSEAIALRAISPAGSRLESVELDGEPIGLLDARNAQLFVPGDLKHHALRLAWSSPGFVATVPELRLAGGQVDPGEVDFIVCVPPDTDVVGTATEISEPNRTGRSLSPGAESGYLLFGGIPRHFRAVDRQPLDLHLAPTVPGYPIWEPVIIVGLSLAALVMLLLRSAATVPEVAACIAVAAVAALGLAAAALLIVPAAVIVWRIQQLIRSSAARAAGHEQNSGTS